MPKECKDQFVELLLALWRAEDPLRTPTLAALLELPVFARVPDVDFGMDSQHFLGPHDSSDVFDPEVQKEAQKIISRIGSIHNLCLRFHAPSLKDAGLDASILLRKGFSSSALKTAGFTPEDLKVAECENGGLETFESSEYDVSDPEIYAWLVCAHQLRDVSEAMKDLCEKDRYDSASTSPEHRESSKGFLQQDKQLMLVHPETCRVFFRYGIGDALGRAVQKLIETRHYLEARMSAIAVEHRAEYDQACALQAPAIIVQHFIGMECGTEAQVLRAMKLCDGDVEATLNLLTSGTNLDDFAEETILSRRSRGNLQRDISDMARFNAQGMKHAHQKKVEHLKGLFRSIDEIESLILLIMEQCAVVRHPASFMISFCILHDFQHRKRQSLMFFSANETLVSFLSMQADKPSQKSGNYVLISLFVQLFASSDPGNTNLAKLGECRPIFDTQTKLESLITHKLFENVQQTCTEGSSSILQRIFNFASEMMQKFVDQTSSRDHQVDITSSEQNLEYALCALVNISRSFRWCIESNVSPNPYSRVKPCVNCEFNSLTSRFCRMLLPLKKAMPKLQVRGKFGARMSHLISDWWYRISSPFLCECSCDKAVGNDELKTIKRIVSPKFLNCSTKMNPSLQVVLSGVPSSSPEDSPKSCSSPQLSMQRPPSKLFPSLDLGPRATLSRTPSAQVESLCTPPATREESPHETPRECWSRTRVSTPRSDSKPPGTPKTLTCVEKILKLLENRQQGRSSAGDNIE